MNMPANWRRMRSPMQPMPAEVPMGGDGETSQVDLGRVGHSDPSSKWMRLEGQQAWVEVTLRNGEEIVASVADEVRDLAIGDTVVIVYVDGDPTQAQVIARRHDNKAPMPDEVAGVSTGAAGTELDGKTDFAPTFTFVRTREGRLFALETGEGGDVLLHSGAAVHVKATTTHIEGNVRLGAAPIDAPLGSRVAPENGERAGIPLVPFVPLPGANATLPPYAGFARGVVRASDEYQSNIAIDPVYWTKIAAMETMFAAWKSVLPALEPAWDIYVAVPPPVAINSQAKTASQTVTAED